MPQIKFCKLAALHSRGKLSEFDQIDIVSVWRSRERTSEHELLALR